MEKREKKRARGLGLTGESVKRPKPAYLVGLPGRGLTWIDKLVRSWEPPPLPPVTAKHPTDLDCPW